MTIVYAVISRSRDAAVLVEVATEALTGSNAPQVTTALLEHLRDNPSSLKEGDLKTYIHRNEPGGWDSGDIFNQFMQACTINITTAEELDLGAVQEHYFHLWSEGGVFYCCLSDDPEPRQQKVCFAFLQAVARDFNATYSVRRIRNCNAYALDKDFQPSLRSSMDYYNLNNKKLGRDQKVNELMAQVEDMRTVLGRNVTLLLERETKLDRLMEKSEQTRRDSLVFKRKSTMLKREQSNKSFKLWLLIALMFLALIITLMFSSCAFLRDCESEN